MRVKIIVPVLCGAAMVLLASWFVRFDAASPLQPASSPGAQPRALSVQAHKLPYGAVNSKWEQPTGDADPVPIAAAIEAQRASDSVQRVAELRDLATSADPAALDTILSQLSDSDPVIRRAALDAAIEFGDRAAIPALNDALASSQDPQDRANIQRAIDYLRLPSLTEFSALN